MRYDVRISFAVAQFLCTLHLDLCRQINIQVPSLALDVAAALGLGNHGNRLIIRVSVHVLDNGASFVTLGAIVSPAIRHTDLSGFSTYHAKTLQPD